jgi:hypothetical protein
VCAAPRIALAFPTQFGKMRYAGRANFHTILSCEFCVTTKTFQRPGRLIPAGHGQSAVPPGGARPPRRPVYIVVESTPRALANVGA